MTPADFAAAWEDAQLGKVLACLIAAALVIAIWVRYEWQASKPDRQSRMRRVK